MPRVTSLKKLTPFLPAAISCQQLLSQVGVGLFCPVPNVKILSNMSLYKSCSYFLNTCEYTWATDLFVSIKYVPLKLSTTPILTIILVYLSRSSLSLGEEYCIYVPIVAEYQTVSYSLFVDQLNISALAVFDCKGFISSQDWDALIYGYSNKS